jgi:hypothetical protein
VAERPAYLKLEARFYQHHFVDKGALLAEVAREGGSRGGRAAGTYIVAALEKLGLQPAGDNGTFVLDNHFPDKFVTQPTLWQQYGTSYFFRTEIAFRQFSQTSFRLPADVNVVFDGAGHWHGGGPALREDMQQDEFFGAYRQLRYNVLFGDFHAKSQNVDENNRAWQTDL